MHNVNLQRREIRIGSRTLVLETGKIARQADGAVLASWGETTVLATVVSAKAPKPGQDFFPLTVDYQEKTYAAGKIPGGFFKREGRATERATLTARMIDRPIRPHQLRASLLRLPLSRHGEHHRRQPHHPSMKSTHACFPYASGNGPVLVPKLCRSIPYRCNKASSMFDVRSLCSG